MSIDKEDIELEQKISIKDTSVGSQTLPPPSQSIDISFKNITYTVSTSAFKKRRKTILNGVSGLFKSGELTAIMGASGAGKSSLLNTLSGFIKEGVEGEMFANGTLLDKKKSLIKNHSSYILQDDYLNPLFTVNEIMHHAADLKLTSITHKAKELLIKDVLDNMAMGSTANTFCSKLSGGQRKRLNVCLELINNPSILYLDEPTSGLDSSSCSLLINKLKDLAESGRTVVCTIHQPSASIFSQFDHLYFLSKGITVYEGSPPNLIPFLTSIGLICPVYHNPADFMMDVATGEFGNFKDQMVEALNSKEWRFLSHKKSLFSEETRIEYSSGFLNNNNNNVGEEKPSEWHRYLCILSRMGKILHRDWMMSYFRLVFHVGISFLVASVFIGGGNNAAYVLKNFGYFVGTTIYISFTSAIPATLKFPAEFRVIKKEHFNNWYKFTTFYLAFLTVTLPVQLICNGTFTVLSYYLTSQSMEPMRLILFLIAQSFTTIISELYGLALGSMSNPVHSVTICSVIMGIFAMLGGFFALFKDMSILMKFLSTLGYMRYIFEIQVLSQYGYNRPKLHCPRSEFYCHFREPKMIMEMLGLQEYQVWTNIGILIMYSLLFILIAYVLIRRRLKVFN